MTPQDERGLPREPVNVVSPGAYCVSDFVGDVTGAGEGLFYKDTRHLSRFVLKVDARTLVPQDTRARGSTAEFFLVAAEGEIQATRRRELGGGTREEIRLKKYLPDLLQPPSLGGRGGAAPPLARCSASSPIPGISTSTRCAG